MGASGGVRSWIGGQRCLSAIDSFEGRRYAAFVMQLDFLAFLAAFVGEDDADARIEEGQFAIAVFELVEIEFGDLEGLMARQEGDARAFLEIGRASFRERVCQYV